MPRASRWTLSAVALAAAIAVPTAAMANGVVAAGCSSGVSVARLRLAWDRLDADLRIGMDRRGGAHR